MKPRVAGRLKNALHAAQEENEIRNATLDLFRHSLRFEHGRLLLKRLEAAVACNAPLTDDDIERCLACLLARNDQHINLRLLRLSQRLS